MKVTVVGAGALGSLVGGLLAERGADVTLIGRHSHVEAIRREGLHIGGAVGERIVRVEAREELREKPDLTIFAVKTQDLAKTCQEVAPLIGRGPVIMMQNGVRCDGIARHFFTPDRIVGCVVFSMATFLDPGEIECQVRGWLTIGNPFSPVTFRIQEIKRTLEKALPVRISQDIAAVRWTKLIGNLNNALPAITGCPLQGIYFSPETSKLPLRLMWEGLQTLSKAGIRTDRSPQDLAMRLATRLPEPVPLALLRLVARSRLGEISMLGSTWQSVVRGCATEIDYLNGEIVTIGREVDYPTPYNSRVVQLVHEIEKSSKFRPPHELWPV